MQQAGIQPHPDPRLARWATILDGARPDPVLDLGCGEGQDAAWLTAHGVHVIAGDYSGRAVMAARQVAPAASFIQMDLRDGLPFPRATFNIIVAGLCLHYFTHKQTRRILADVRTCLRPGGQLLARVNSRQDVNYGACGHAEVEPGCYLVNGELKRFFTREDVQDLFADGWTLYHLEEMTIHRYHKPKVVWEIRVEKV